MRSCGATKALFHPFGLFLISALLPVLSLSAHAFQEGKKEETRFHPIIARVAWQRPAGPSPLHPSNSDRRQEHLHPFSAQNGRQTPLPGGKGQITLQKNAGCKKRVAPLRM